MGKGQSLKSQRTPACRGRASSKKRTQSDRGTEELQQSEAAEAREQRVLDGPDTVDTIRTRWPVSFEKESRVVVHTFNFSVCTPEADAA